MTEISNNKPETEKMNIEHRTSNIERRMKDKTHRAPARMRHTGLEFGFYIFNTLQRMGFF